MNLTRIELIEFIIICLTPLVLSIILHIVTLRVMSRRTEKMRKVMIKALKVIYFTLSNFLEHKELDADKIHKVLKTTQEEIASLERKIQKKDGHKK